MLKKILRELLGLVLLLPLSPSLATYQPDADIAALYKAQDVEGVLMIVSLEGKEKYMHNAGEIDNAYIPASTFKIAHTLIALEEGIIKDQTVNIPWDGVQRTYAPWNKDQTLATAFAYSCVWCYQTFARHISHQQYRQYLQAFDYGNAKTGEQVTDFWLKGDLRISVSQQIAFLRKVYLEQLPVKTSSLRVLKEIMLSEASTNYQIWSKTGWQGEHGWYVGYVQRENNVWLFAHYMKVQNQSDLPLRKSIAHEAFKLKGIL